MSIEFMKDPYLVLEGTSWVANVDEPRLEEIIKWFKEDFASGKAMVGDTGMSPDKGMDIRIVGPIQYCGPHGMIESSIKATGEIEKDLPHNLTKMPISNFSAHVKDDQISFLVIMGYQKLWR